jgi:hypothetical protein
MPSWAQEIVNVFWRCCSIDRHFCYYLQVGPVDRRAWCKQHCEIYRPFCVLHETYSPAITKNPEVLARSTLHCHQPLITTPTPPPLQKKCENLFLSNNMNSVKYFAHFSNKIKLEFGFAFLIYEHQYYVQNTEDKCQWDRHCIPPSLQVTVTHPRVLFAFFGSCFSW